MNGVKVVHKISMVKKLLKKIFFYITFFILLNCKDNNVKKTIKLSEFNKIEVIDTSFSSFLKFPLKTNDKDKLIGLSSFNLKYRIFKNKHSDSITYSNDIDSIALYSFKNGDTIEYLKNRYTKQIIFLKLSKSGIPFSNGGFVGMNSLDFIQLFKLKINKKDSIARYEDDFYKLNFIFEKGHLTKIKYENTVE